MTIRLFLPLAVLAGSMSFSLSAQGRLALMPQGQYVCATPGTANGQAWVEDVGLAFAITGASSYRTVRGSGVYLLEGNEFSFTRGPLKGMRFLRMGNGLLQERGEDGRLTRLRCHRSGPLEP